MNFAVVIPNKHLELARNLIHSIRLTHDLTPLIIVVADGHSEEFGRNTQTIKSPHEHFVFARNVNLGIIAAGNKDVILANDDCHLIQKDSLSKLVSVAARHPRLGILSPLIDGGVENPYQRCDNWDPKWPEVIGIPGTEWNSMPVCFPFVFLSRAMINAIGLLDEQFDGYGFDDNDYCLRARRAGWETGITGAVTVMHGSGGSELDRGENWSQSFAHEEPGRPSNEALFRSKYPQPITILPQ